VRANATGRSSSASQLSPPRVRQVANNGGATPFAQKQEAADSTAEYGQAQVRTLTVMITDMAGSTRYAERFGPRAAFLKRRRHNAILIPLFERFSGVFVEAAGDSLLAVFDSAADAARCAVAIQRRLAEHNRETAYDLQDHKIQVRIGLHTGKLLLYRDGGNVEVAGSGVNVASRVEAADDRKPDQILLSASTVNAIGRGGGSQFCFAFVGRLYAKGVGSLRLYRLLWDDA